MVLSIKEKEYNLQKISMFFVCGSGMINIIKPTHFIFYTIQAEQPKKMVLLKGDRLRNRFEIGFSSAHSLPNPIKYLQ
jgi:hypothetical protein